GYRGAGLSKLEYASYLTAALAYLLIRQQDRVGLLAFAEPKHTVYVPPRARSTHLHDLLGVIEGINTKGGLSATGLAAALDRVGELSQRRRSLIVILSDLLDPSPEIPALLRRLRAQRHDVAVFHVLDKDELELPFDGVQLFQSMEDDRRLLADP